MAVPETVEAQAGSSFYNNQKMSRYNKTNKTFQKFITIKKMLFKLTIKTFSNKRQLNKRVIGPSQIVFYDSSEWVNGICTKNNNKIVLNKCISTKLNLCNLQKVDKTSVRQQILLQVVYIS